MIDYNELEAFRKHLHANPELSGQEHETSALLLQKLRALKADEVLPIAKTGVLVRFEGNEAGATVMVRGDIDALPIAEVNTFAHASTKQGISHKCGHDGHTTILFGLAQALAKKGLARGTVWLLFQPSEENGAGANAVIADKYFDRVTPDYAFALHNAPGFPLHQILYRTGNFTPAVTSIIFKFSGKTSHAAEPEKGHNPAWAIAHTLLACTALDNNVPESENMVVVTPVYQHLGERSYGVSAGYGELHLTVRTWHNHLLDDVCAQMEIIAHKQAEIHHLTVEISYTETFRANQNHPDAVAFVKRAADELQLNSLQKPTPFKWGEDFGLFTEKYKGCMFGIGSGKETPALHNPDYDYPDEITETGVNMFLNIINLCTKQT